MSPANRTQASTWEEDAPLVASEPPPWFARALSWLIISLFAVIVVTSIVVKVSETVNARFILVTEGGADPIASPRQAVLERVHLKVGQEVKKGDPLYVEGRLEYSQTEDDKGQPRYWTDIVVQEMVMLGSTP